MIDWYYSFETGNQFSFIGNFRNIKEIDFLSRTFMQSLILVRKLFSRSKNLPSLLIRLVPVKYSNGNIQNIENIESFC